MVFENTTIRSFAVCGVAGIVAAQRRECGSGLKSGFGTVVLS
jgi:hypothetical protein